MAKILTKNSFTSGVTPSGLSAGELAVNVSDKKLFVGNAVGGVVTLHDQNNVVTSINGATGAVGITFGKNIQLTLSGQTLTIGISAARPGDTGAIQFSDGGGGLSASAVFNYTPSSGVLRVGGATRWITLYTSGANNIVANNGSANLMFSAPGFGAYVGDPLSGASGTYVLVDSTATDGVTIRAKTTTFDRALPIITGTNPSGYLSIRTTGTDYIVPCNPIITLQDADNDLGSRSSILITPSVGSASDLYLGSTSLTDTTIRGTSVTLVPRSTHVGGITAAHLYVSGGATFGSSVNLLGALLINGNTGTNNQVLTSTGSGITWATAAGGGGGLSWSAVTANRSLVAEEGVLANISSGTLTLTLPTTAALGKVIRVSGMQNTWRIAQNASQKINFGKTSTTVGTGGYLESSNARDAVELVCCVANTEWNVISSIGNITIV